jgi:hypothetical protein
MSCKQPSSPPRGKQFGLDQKLAAYLAAAAAGSLVANQAQAVIVSSSTVQPFGINGAVPIDFNSDGQIDFEIDHDRVDLGGGNLVDYLQLDKNDINGENNPLAFDPLTNFQAATFPPGATTPNDANNSAYLLENPPNDGANLEYPAALLAGAEIGANSFFDFQEGDNVYNSGKTGRLNRLIDEDHGQVDMVQGGKTADQIVTPTNTPQFLGVLNQTRYLGVRMDLNNTSANNTASELNYGWIGIKITNEIDATGEVVGYGYETQPGVPIAAGTTGILTGDYNNNGTVDAADYVIWRKNNGLMGGATPAQGDGTGDGNVTVEDYNLWRTSFGNGTGAGALIAGSASLQGVPEPSSLLLTAVGAIAIIGAFFNRRFRR